MKTLRRWLPHMLYRWERLAGWLWEALGADRASYWLDGLPAITYGWRKNAERVYCSTYSENVYGEPLR